MVGATISGGSLLTVEPAASPRLGTDSLEPKYRAPRLHEALVERTELLDRLHDAHGVPLVLVAAPAGYGKTTLLAQWSDQDARRFAWLTLDETDRDPAVLADSIATALRPTGVVGAGFVLVIDDAHIGHPAALRDAVLDVLEWLPQGSQVAIAARCEPLLPVSRMRAQRTLLHIGAGALAMSTGEGALLLRNAGLDLEFIAVQDLIRRTEGWPVALQLAATSVAALRYPAQALAQLAGDDHLLSEYFRAEFLAGLSPSTLRFLTRSSVLDQISGPLCDAVLQRTRSAAVLARLALTNLPLRPADPSHEWYRFHGLFREMLQTELRRSEPETPPALHRRAGDWHRRAGDLDRAIEHARRAGDLDRVGEWLWSSLPAYLASGRNDVVQGWLSGVTAEQTTGCAPFALAAAHSHLAMGNAALAEQWARSAAVSLSGKSGGQADGQRAGAILVQAWAARLGAARMAQDATNAHDLLPDDSPWRASSCFLGGTAALLTDDHAAAERHFEEGAARGACQAPHVAALCLAQLAVVALEHGDAEGAGDLARRARGVVEEHDLSSQPMSALVFAVSAAAAVRERRGDEAKAAASQCVSAIGMLENFVPWYGAEIRILLARGSLVLGDVAGARRQLADASRLARRTAGVVVFQRWFEDAWERFDKCAETAFIGAGSLTTAELRVLRFLPTHFSFHEIAERLHVSSNTVKTHVHAVYRKLDASSRSEAVANATRAGLLGS